MVAHGAHLVEDYKPYYFSRQRTYYAKGTAKASVCVTGPPRLPTPVSSAHKASKLVDIYGYVLNLRVLAMLYGWRYLLI
jgi:hypothetical protein